ncbi:MAG: HepT-like ribonuclease domain-containing protein [Methylococcaceae bacterium]
MKDRLIYILAAYDCIQSIEDYTNGYELIDFINDKKTQDAVIRNVDVLGQTFRDFGLEELAEKYPDLPWLKISRMQHITSYKSLGADNKVTVWETVSYPQLSAFKDALEHLLYTEFG